MTRLLPILSRALSNPGVRVVTYIGDVFEESPVRGRKLADEMGAKGIKLIVLHDTATGTPSATPRCSLIWRAAPAAACCRSMPTRRRGCANCWRRSRCMPWAAATCSKQKRDELPGAVLLLEHLRRDR